MKKILIVFIILTMLMSCVTASVGIGTRVGKARGGVRIDSTGRIGGGLSIGF